MPRYEVVKKPFVVDPKFGGGTWQPAHVGTLTYELAEQLAEKLKGKYVTEIREVEDINGTSVPERKTV